MRHAKVFVAIALSSSAFLVVLYSSLRSDANHTRKLFMQEDNPIQEVIVSMPPPVQQNTDPLPLMTAGPPVEISEDYRKAIKQSTAFWNRKQHSLFRKLDSKDNVTKADFGDWSKCSAISLESLSTNIQDFKSYPQDYQDFLSGMECRDPPILIDQPQKCQSEEDGEVYLLFAIKSVPGSFERRQTVRQTWGQEKVYEGGLRVRTVFLLGMWSMDDPNLNQLVSFEAQHFGDVLQWDFKDTFYNLTLKENAFFRWSLTRCPRVTFVFKGDDDVFVNTQTMLDYLRTLDPNKASKLYMGHIISNSDPIRDSNSKYYVPKTFFEGGYSSYAGGGGFLFSGNLLTELYRVSKYIPFFSIDDVYTGMCFQALGIKPEAHDGFRTFDIRQEDRENACVHKNLILVHRRSPQQTLRLWRYVHSPLLTC
uniref:Hexosyltransferase n=1 Tax=Paramormyrops kingsleyae TaxID=1676925 RepID=A0A3B3SS07_9TELE|nr:N-acetyllactosaminide beta-1,3-N-acetylglucosaminyltransferase 2-like [Paramormyrops kingsleyae]